MPDDDRAVDVGVGRRAGCSKVATEAPAAQRVGLIVPEGVSCWGDLEIARADLVNTALVMSLPDSLHWNAVWCNNSIQELRLEVRCLVVVADTRNTGWAIRQLLRPIDAERSTLSFGGLRAEGGRTIPIMFQPEGARDGKKAEWAQKACMFVLDTKFRSWGARRLVVITFAGVVELGQSSPSRHPVFRASRRATWACRASSKWMRMSQARARLGCG